MRKIIATALLLSLNTAAIAQDSDSRNTERQYVAGLIHHRIAQHSPHDGFKDDRTRKQIFQFITGTWGEADLLGKPKPANSGAPCESGYSVPKATATKIPKQYLRKDRSGLGAFQGDDAPDKTIGGLTFFTDTNGKMYVAEPGGYHPGRGRLAVVGMVSFAQSDTALTISFPYQSRSYNLSIIGPNEIGFTNISPGGGLMAAPDKKRYYRCQTGE